MLQRRISVDAPSSSTGRDRGGNMIFLLFQLLTVMRKTCNSSRGVSLLLWASIKIRLPPSPCSSPRAGCIDLSFRCQQMITAILSCWMLLGPGLPHYWTLFLGAQRWLSCQTAQLWKPKMKKKYCANLFLPPLKPIFSLCFCHLLQLLLSCPYIAFSLSEIICILTELPVSFHLSFITSTAAWIAK